MRRLVLLGCLAFLGVPVRTAVAAEPMTVSVGTSALKITPLELPGLEAREESDDQLRAWWTGTVGTSKVDVALRVFPHKDYRLRDPQAVVQYAQRILRKPEHDGDPAFAFAKTETLSGAYGWVPAAVLAFGPLPSAAAPSGEVMMLGGVLEDHAYEVTVEAKPALSASDRAKALAFLRDGIRATGAVQVPGWTDAEATARWAEVAPDEKIRKNLRDPVRTKHYILFTDSGAGALFAKKMESCYEQIQKVFPFPEVAWRRLMPVFLFKDFEGYVAFGKKQGMDDVAETKGHAWKDYYATYYDSPNDPVHIHEGTHQIFGNRLHLDGAGSWFQEAVAEYMCTSPSERRSFARQAVKSGTYCPFRTFVKTKDLIAGAEPLDGGAAYTQAASIIEYLRESFKDPALFQRFVHEVGVLPDHDVPALDAKLKEIYGFDLDGMQAGWIKYWQSK